MREPHDSTRRQFITAAALTGLAWTGAARAIDPIQRVGRGRLRLGLAAYSLWKYLKADPQTPGAIDLTGFVDFAAGLDIDAVELTAYYFPPDPDRQYLLGLKRQCHALGLDISGGAIGNNFARPDGPELDEQMAYTRAWLDRYAVLGAPVVRVFAGTPPPGTSESQGVARVVANLRVACEYAGRHGLVLALENHDYLMRIERLIEIVRQIESPWLGVNLDSGNVPGAEPYEAIRSMAPYAMNVQVKTYIPTDTRGGKEPTDYRRVIQILRDAGYSGYIVLEYEADEDPYQAVPRHLAALREAMD